MSSDRQFKLEKDIVCVVKTRVVPSRVIAVWFNFKYFGRQNVFHLVYKFVHNITCYIITGNDVLTHVNIIIYDVFDRFLLSFRPQITRKTLKLRIKINSVIYYYYVIIDICIECEWLFKIE